MVNQWFLSEGVTLTETIAVEFPDPNGLVQQAWQIAWPEVLKFGGACVGILLAAYVIRSFRNK